MSSWAPVSVTLYVSLARVSTMQSVRTSGTITLVCACRATLDRPARLILTSAHLVHAATDQRVLMESPPTAVYVPVDSLVQCKIYPR